MEKTRGYRLFGEERGGRTVHYSYRLYIKQVKKSILVTDGEALLIELWSTGFQLSNIKGKESIHVFCLLMLSEVPSRLCPYPKLSHPYSPDVIIYSMTVINLL